MSIRRETRADDKRRSYSLLDAVDAAFEKDDSATFEPDSFESVVLHGIANDPTEPYPPAGHTYPKRG